MALDWENPEVVAQEIERAEHMAKAHSEITDELSFGYHSKFFRKDRQPETDQPENAAYEFVTLMLPLLAYDNPAVQVESRKVTTDEQTAIGMQEVLNGWVVEEDLQRLLEIVALDFLFSHGVILTTFEPYGGRDHGDALPPVLTPRAHYVHPKRFLLDPLAVANLIDGEGFDGLRFMGHKWVRDRGTLLTDARFDRAAVESLVADVDLRDLNRPTNEQSPSRDEVIGYEIWVPPEVCDPHATTNGTIYTLAAHQMSKDKKGKAAFIRKPRPYYGPSWGPYSFFGAYPVAGEAYPLGPIAAVAAQAEEVNAHANAASRAASRQKSIVLVDANENAAAGAVKNAKDGEIWRVPNLNPDKIQQLEIGAVSDQRYRYLELLRERLDRNSGVNDARRGNIVQGALATAIDTAQEANSSRDAFLKKKFAQGVTQVLRTAGWYFHQSANVVRPLSPAAGKRLNMRYPVFHGGIQEGQEQQTFADLGLRIEAYSLERPNEAKLQSLTLQLVQWLTGVSQAMPQVTWIDWEAMVEMVGRIFNHRHLSQLLIPQRLDQLRQAMAQAAQQGQQQQAKPPAISINFKDMPEPDKAAVMGRLGLPVPQDTMTNDQRLTAIGHQNAANKDLRAATHDAMKHYHAITRPAAPAPMQPQPAGVA